MSSLFMHMYVSLVDLYLCVTRKKESLPFIVLLGHNAYTHVLYPISLSKTSQLGVFLHISACHVVGATGASSTTCQASLDEAVKGWLWLQSCAK